MLISLLNFVWIAFCAFLFGFAVCRILTRFHLIADAFPAPDFIFVAGIAALTAFSQWFSIFYRIGILATFVLVLLDALIVLLLFRSLKEWIITFFHSCNIYRYLFWLSLAAFFFSILASTAPVVYDTSLYHVQAIEWIEKYGVVKGLGNLHNRLAYNSSFFALQALFSWNSIVGQSLHGMNCLLALFFSSYAVSRIWSYFRQSVSSCYPVLEQIFNFLILYQIFSSATGLSSPGTDLLPMLLILYIFSRWSRDPEQLPFLFLTAVFGATVKLSIASLVIIGIPLCITVLLQKRWKQFFCYAILCLYLALPFLIRNILISGYLLYPSTLLDLFSVDWKMPAYTVTFDNHEIIAWGRRLNDVNKYGWPITRWFPIWFSDISFSEKMLFAGHILFIPLAVFRILFSILKRKTDAITGMFTVSLVGLLTWFFSSPLIRYGNVYLCLIPAICAGQLLHRWKFTRRVTQVLLPLAGCILVTWMPLSVIPKYPVIRLINPNDYEAFACSTREIAPGIQIYYPTETPERTGYDTFPSTPYPKRLDLIELRGDSLEDGFRIRPEFKDRKITTYGDILP